MDLIAQLRLDLATPDNARYATARKIAKDSANAPHIRVLLDDTDPTMAAMAAWMVASYAQGDNSKELALAGSLLPELMRRATDPDVRVRKDVVRALQFFTSHAAYREQVIPCLRNALTDSEIDVCSSAAHGLLRVKAALPEVALALGNTLDHPESPGSNGHQEACMSLENMGSDGASALPALRRRLETASDPDLAASIRDAIAAIS
jgi:hypothetical protein